MNGLVRNRLQRRLCGFTVIEIIMVVLIIAIAAVMAVPMLSSAAGMQARSAASIIAADLEYARSMAVTRQRNYAVFFDVANDSYEIKVKNGAVYEAIPHPVKKGFDYVMDFGSDSRLNRVDITEADFDSTSTVEFDYLGSVYNGSGAPLNSGVVRLQAGAETMTVNVAPVTGYISIQ